MPGSFDAGSRFQVLAQVTASPMGRSTSSPPGLNHWGTKVEKTLPPRHGSRILYEDPVPGSLAQAGQAQGHTKLSPFPAPFGSLIRLFGKTQSLKKADRQGFRLQGLPPLRKGWLRHTHDLWYQPAP